MKPASFIEAIQWARARRVVLPDTYYGELQGLARSMAFSIAGMAKLDQLQQVMDSLSEATANGETFRDWQKRAEIEALDLPAHRLEVIFRTNIQGHYGRGRCEQQAHTADSHPYLLYDAINDSRTRPSHAAMDGFIAHRDDPIWQRWRPPAGYQCRCRTIAMTEDQAQRFIEADRKRLQDPGRATARANAQPDPGWDYDPCAEPTEGLRRAWDEKVAQAHPLLAQAAEEMAEEVKPDKPEWVILRRGEVTLEKVKRLGGERLEELMDTAIDKGKPLRELVDAIARARSIDAAAVRALYEAIPQVKRALQQRMAEVRSVGAVPVATYNKTGKGKELMARVAAKLPSNWVAHSNAQGPLRIKVSGTRGYHHPAEWNNATARQERTISTRDGSTAEHEYAHALQSADPDLDALFVAEHRRRTEGDPLVPLYDHAPTETGRPDHYVDPYQGREYAHGPREVITMALQAALGEDQYSDQLMAASLVSDPEMIKLVLGVLLHYDP